MPQELFHVVEMERQLRSDKTGSIRDEILNTLRSNKSSLKQLLNGTSLTPADFEGIQKLCNAVEQAEIVVESYWLANHQN